MRIKHCLFQASDFMLNFLTVMRNSSVVHVAFVAPDSKMQVLDYELKIWCF
jgi:hypothetical protein